MLNQISNIQSYNWCGRRRTAAFIAADIAAAAANEDIYDDGKNPGAINIGGW